MEGVREVLTTAEHTDERTADTTADRWAAVVALTTFIMGVAAIALTFWLAFSLFRTAPDKVLGLQRETPLDVDVAGRSGMRLLYQIAFLIVMALSGSLIASRGIRLYATSRGTPSAQPRRPKRDRE